MALKSYTDFIPAQITGPHTHGASPKYFRGLNHTYGKDETNVALLPKTAAGT